MSDAISPVIALMGPTASGKTELALALADRLGCGLINVDSAQVYRGLNIGSAKPDEVTLTRHPHELVDIREPTEPYSAADFRRDALAAVQRQHRAGRIPLLVGGTMLYFRVLFDGIADLPVADSALREELARRCDEEGSEALHRELAGVDPESARRIHPRNRQRVQRALEVWYLSGRPLSALQSEANSPVFPWRSIQIALAPFDRAALHQRIADRFHTMLAQGLVEEVRRLRERPGMQRDLPAMRAVGYRQVWDYLDGLCTYEEMVERGIIATRRLARRQLTWLRGWDGLRWIWTDTAGRCVDSSGRPLLRAGRALNPLEQVLNLLAEAAICIRS